MDEGRRVGIDVDIIGFGVGTLVGVDVAAADTRWNIIYFLTIHTIDI